MKRLQLRVMDLTNPKKLTNTEIKNILGGNSPGGSGGYNIICYYSNNPDHVEYWSPWDIFQCTDYCTLESVQWGADVTCSISTVATGCRSAWCDWIS